jgi:arabinogalactan endo-1,4-beta-galactosidase
MKNIVFLAVMLINFHCCFSQNIVSSRVKIDLNDLYPSPSIIIPYHSEWTRTHYNERIAEFKANPLQFGDIVFIGNSITEQGGNWGQKFNNSKIKNRGIAGDNTAGVINRLAEIYYYKPEKVFLKIGINDLFQSQLTPEYVANNIKQIVDKIHLESPTTKIYVQTILPTANNNPSKEKIAATNTLLKAIVPTNYLQILDLHSVFADANDAMISSYTTDGLHLTNAGYTVWQNYVKEYVNDTQDFSKGGDISWVPQMEATGYKFYNSNGVETDCLQLLKDKGMNTVRLRVFVNPSSDKIKGHCSPAETIALAVRAKAAGMRIMIDFHYSDSFADPGQQTKPAAWASYTVAQLSDAVYNHTFTVLNDLKTAGVTPEWVQIGNEIPVGLLWPEGKTTNWSQLAQFLNRGYDATKAVDAAIKVVIHLDQGNNGSKFRTFFDNAKTRNVKYDVIGMSYYPYWLGQKNPSLLDYNQTITNLENNMKDMVTRYGKEVMVVEVGGDDTKARNTYDMLKAVIAAVKSVPNNKGLGVIYWEPQGQRSWSGYALNAWQSNGKPSDALNAFNDVLPRPAPDEYVKLDGFVANPVEQGKSFTANLTYTANSSTHFFYIGLVHRQSDGTFIKNIVQSTNNQFLVPSVGENLTSQVTLTVPADTVPSASLPNGEYYDVSVQLWSAGAPFFGTRLDTSLASILTILPLTSDISVTAIPLSTKVGTNLVVSYKYTVGAAARVRINVTKNGGATASTFISTVAFAVVNPAAAGADVTGTFTLPISGAIIPTANLTGNENYRIRVELFTSADTFIKGVYYTNYNFTPATTTWTGASNSIWTNASNWTNGVPTSIQDVVIGSSSNQPNINTNVAIKSLFINATASLKINGGFNLSVTDAIINNGTLTIENNANLIQGGTTNSNTGNAIVKRNSNPLYRLDYTMWSSPVSGTQTLAQFSPLTSQMPNRFYTYNSSSNAYSNIAPASTFATGTGYLIRMPNTYESTDYNTGISTLIYSGEFVGVPNNGDLTLSGLIPNKFYAIGNPYPSTISANAFINGNSTDGTLYFWRKKNGIGGSAYATYNLVGTTATAAASGVSGSGSEIPNGTIQVGQGFIVKTGSAATSLSFTNAMRVGTISTQFFKSKQLTQKDRVWLNLTRPAFKITTSIGTEEIPEIFSQALVGYMEGATLGIDNGIDAKYINDSQTALTSNINQEEFTIQGRPLFNVNDVVGFNFKTDVAGDYTIALDHFDGVFAAGQDIYLVDSKVKSETNLKFGSYLFQSDAGEYNSRFSLKYQKTLKVNTPVFNENSVSMFSKNGKLHINSASIAIGSIKVFDILGKLLVEQTDIKSNSIVVNNLKASNQVLIIKIVGEDNSIVTKKIIH